MTKKSNVIAQKAAPTLYFGFHFVTQCDAEFPIANSPLLNIYYPGPTISNNNHVV